MPHADDGTLHALMDGALRADQPDEADRVEAHLARCEDCRARLEAARDVKGRAATVLESAAPDDLAADLLVPDFAEVLARAGSQAGGGAIDQGAMADRAGRPGPARTPGLRRQVTWTRRLGWAASLILALGTGYLIRDLAEPAGPERAPAATSPGAPGSAAATRRTEPPVSAESGPADVERRESARTDPSGDESVGAETPAAEAPAAETAPVDVAAAADVVEETESMDRVARQDLQTAQGAEAGRADVPVAQAAAAATPERTEPLPAPQPRLAPRFRAIAERPETGMLMEEAREQLAEPGLLRWTGVTADSARVALAGPVYRLDRAEVLEVYVEDTDAARVMTVQRLPSGILVRVIQWRGSTAELDVAAGVVGADRDGEVARRAPDAPAAGSSANRVRLVRGPFVLELWGRLPTELLETLANTAEPLP